jgi:aralkylamine N-acetyltransferase
MLLFSNAIKFSRHWEKALEISIRISAQRRLNLMEPPPTTSIVRIREADRSGTGYPFYSRRSNSGPSLVGDQMGKMAAGDVSLRLVRQWNCTNIADLYRAGGWWREEWDDAAIQPLISGSFAFVVAVESSTGQAVGMGRAIADGVSDAYLQDVVVMPDYRRQGIGRQIVGELIRHCTEAGISWIGVIAEPGSDGLYAALGFIELTGHIPMLYQTGDPYA